jgi:heat shock protein beta
MRLLTRCLFLGICLVFLLTLFTTQASEHEVRSPVTTENAQQKSEKHEFQAEVSRVMKIIINSLYKSKDIFLRELVSNASDALDKLRFFAIEHPEVLKEYPDLKIEVKADKQKGTLTIRDTGVGMTKEELRKNLGTIAKSGTADFVSALEQNKADVGLIGQFGVGFYSSFLVADTVTVTSKSNKDKQYIWESNANQSFTIAEDPRNHLNRGTEITLYLKQDAQEYLSQERLNALLARYSEFINFPIYLWSHKVEREKVAEESDAEAKGETKPAADDDDELSVEDIEEKERLKTTTVAKDVYEWTQMNTNKPVWMRSPKEVTEEEYADFFKSYAKDYQPPMQHIHFRAEGDIDFKALLFVPPRAPHNFLQNMRDVTSPIKLYVRRVFITDENIELLPRWLNFIVGLVDSDDFPLNVSRETLQQSKLLRKIKAKLLGKVLDMLRQLSINDPEKYNTLLDTFGAALKIGITEDKDRGTAFINKVARLLRFHSSHGPDKISFEDYITRMKKGQAQIFYISGANLEECRNSPYVEKLLARGYEVFYFTDTVDEYMMQSLTEFDGKKFQSVAKEGFKYGDEEEGNEKEELIQKQFQPLLDWVSKFLGEDVEKVILSNKLTYTPAIVSATTYGISGNMQRIVNAQPIAEGNIKQQREQYLTQKRILELNPKHPIVLKLLDHVEQETTNVELEKLVRVLYETAIIRSGYPVRDPTAYANKVEKLLRVRLGVEVEEEAEQTVPAVEGDSPVDEDKQETTADEQAVNMDDESGTNEDGTMKLPVHEEL